MHRLISDVVPAASTETSFIPWAALVVAVIAIPVAIWATRRWGNRRGRISVSISSTALIPEGSSRLEVTYRNVAVHSPHLVTVVFRNSGPKDISSSMFDSGKPTAVSFDTTFYGVTSVQGGVNLISRAIGATPPDSIVEIAPGLLRRKAEWSFSAVVTGPVEVAIASTLIDTDLIEEVPSVESDVKVSFSFGGVRAEFPLRQRRPVR